jgi:hypothetical protein
MAMTIEANSIRKPNKFRDNENLTRIAQYLLPQLNQIAMAGNPEPLNAFIKSIGDAMEQDVTDWLIPAMQPQMPPQQGQMPPPEQQIPPQEEMPPEAMPMDMQAPPPEMMQPDVMSQSPEMDPEMMAMLENLPPEALMELSGGL